jgi:hypothetical protein
LGSSPRDHARFGNPAARVARGHNGPEEALFGGFSLVHTNSSP